MQSFLKGVVFSVVMVVALAMPQISLAGTEINGGIGVDTQGHVSGGFSIFGGDATYSGSNPWRPRGYAFLNLPDGTISGIVATILVWLLMMFGFLGILGFVISGVMYILSVGNDDLAKQAKKGMINSLIGIIVGLSGYIIMRFISSILAGAGGTDY